MADILRVTTPLVNKSQMPPQKQPQSDVQFQLSELNKVVKTNAQEGMLKQNNTLVEQESTNMLMEMMKDPAAAVSFIKSIFLLQEVVKLLPVNNQTMTNEMAPLFESLFVQNGDIAAEMMKQENASTIFKGDVFDALRSLLSRHTDAETQGEVTNLLKALNNILRGRDILDSVSNNLTFLSESLSPNKALSEALSQLAYKFRASDAPEKFNEIKKQAITLLMDLEKSILFSDKLEKVSSITVYNLSRFNNNPEFLDDALTTLLNRLPGQEEKSTLFEAVRAFVMQLEAMPQKEPSTVMDVLAKIIGMQAEKKDGSPNAEERVENIIHSILSSPCNYTPLLHFVLPVEYMDVRSFAEIWIDPNEEPENEDSENVERITHVLLAFEVDNIGKFELELQAKGKSLDVSLFCPSEYVDQFAGIGSKIAKGIGTTSYRLNNLIVEKMERQRSLMDVFKTLPYRRAGINVKI